MVGASLAGCRATLALAGRGLRVLLLDKATFPRWKPCAGGVTLKAEGFIHPALRPYDECEMRGAWLNYGKRHERYVDTSRVLGYMVHRETFDEAHLRLAASQPGVEVATGVTVREAFEHGDRIEVATTKGRFDAPALVGADGVNSVVSRLLPGHDARSIGFAFEGEATPADEPLTQDVLFDFRGFPRGYGWIFPKRDHCSIGGFVYGRDLPGIRRLYDEFCAGSRFLRGAKTYRTKGHRIPHGGSPRRLNSRRIVLAGDAADLVDPLTGEGIAYALRSGRMAGEAVADFLAEGTPLDRYGDLVRDTMQRELGRARRCADLLYRHPFLAYHLLMRSRLVCRWFAEILAGERSYASLWDPLESTCMHASLSIL